MPFCEESFEEEVADDPREGEEDESADEHGEEDGGEVIEEDVESVEGGFISCEDEVIVVSEYRFSDLEYPEPDEGQCDGISEKSSEG